MNTNAIENSPANLTLVSGVWAAQALDIMGEEIRAREIETGGYITPEERETMIALAAKCGPEDLAYIGYARDYLPESVLVREKDAPIVEAMWNPVEGKWDY